MSAATEYYGRQKRTVEQKAQRRFRQRVNRVHRHELKGMGGVLTNGVSWWLEVPKHYDKRRERLAICFSDPRANGIIASAASIKGHIESLGGVEEVYLNSLAEHARALKLRQLEPAEPGDPKAFLVRWLAG
jgi:hypothetical protein